MKKFILFAILSLILLPNIANAYVSLSSSATTTPASIEPGQNANLILSISNLGTSAAQNVKLKIRPHAFITLSSTIFDLQSIPSGNSIQVVIPIVISEAATEGTTALQFTIDYNDAADPSGTKSQENFATIFITKRTLLEITKVAYDKEMIQPGDTIKMNIELRNAGGGRIKDLSVSIYNATLPFVPIETSSRFLNNLDAQEMKNASFNIIINKDAKTVAYTVPVTLTYYDESNSLHSDVKYAGLKISGVPEFVISIDKTEKMYAGILGKISISISNRGTAVAQFLTAKFDSGLDVTPKEYYIGNLDPDDSSTVSLEVNLRRISVGKYPLNMSLMYKDPYNKEFSENHVLQFEVSSQPLEVSLTTQLIIAVVILGILYWKRSFVLKLFRRK
jgi:hypothetical protein